MPKLRKNLTTFQAGFTLVELLIVIVIIGILAGVVISVLNPIQQQRRARDGAVKAQLDKMALSAKSLFASSPRIDERSPTLSEFAQGFASSPDIMANCLSNVTSATTSCLFSVISQPLPTDCAVNGYSGMSGGTGCFFTYWRSPDSFIIAARGSANFTRYLTGPKAKPWILPSSTSTTP